MVIHRQKIGFDSRKVTYGDPKDLSNEESARKVNTQSKPQKSSSWRSDNEQRT